MTISVRMSLAGDKKLMRKLKGLSQNNKLNKAVKSAMGKATTPIRKAAADAAKQSRPIMGDRFIGNEIAILAKGVKKRTKKTKAGNIAGVVGTAGSHFYKKQGLPLTYPYLIEFGTDRNPPQPFLRPAFEKTKDQAVQSFRENVVDWVEKNAKKGGK